MTHRKLQILKLSILVFFEALPKSCGFEIPTPCITFQRNVRTNWKVLVHPKSSERMAEYLYYNISLISKRALVFEVQGVTFLLPNT